MDLDLRVVRYFVAVAEELHFGRAASRLFVSQPALSKQIQRLEEQLGGRLFVRDSRHVRLTARGEAFLVDARELLRVAARMQQPADSNQIRIAHIFELSTSRDVADAYALARPEVRLVQHAMDSAAQLQALLENRLDVAIIRVVPQMLIDYSTGWYHTLLRLEPMRLVGRPGDRPRRTASLYERPVEVFGDNADSGLYNTHGYYLTSFEPHPGQPMRWLGTPGAFSHCYAAWRRAPGSAHLLEFDSYASKYANEGLAVHQPREVQPHYPWSIAWRDGAMPDAVAQFLEIAHNIAAVVGWREFDPDADAPWLPNDDPVAHELGLAASKPIPAPRTSQLASPASTSVV